MRISVAEWQRFGFIIRWDRSVWNLIAGPLVDATSLSAVLYFSAIFAVVLGCFTLKQGPVIGEEILEGNNITVSEDSFM